MQTIITLQKYDGKPKEQTAVARTAHVSDLDAFVALQDAVRSAMPDPSLYIPSSEEEIASDLKKSLCVGTWVMQGDGTERLIAYMIARYDGEDPHNYANHFGVKGKALCYWANMDSVVVLSAYRGNGLQQKLASLCEAWRKPEIIGFGCTVSPLNAHSLQNAQALGYEIVARKMMYQGHDRYILRKKLMPLPGKYRHFKGGEYRVLGMAKHSETLAPMVVYQALYGEQGIWVRPAEMWFEQVDRDDYSGPRFVYAEEV